jgi:hypothetical protein
MSAAGHQLHIRLFLEGIEVPVISVQTSSNVNAPATASIQVVPTDKILELKARTMVHVFFWDYTLDPSSILEKTDATQNASGDDVIDPFPQTNLLKGYKLLFGGEVVGLTMMKTPMGRQAVLQCADFSTYWDTSYQFMLDMAADGLFLEDKAQAWAGGNGTLFNTIVDGHTEVMNGALKKRPQTPGLTNVKGLMGGIISLLEQMGGVSDHTAGINDFFTIAELKNHLMQQIVAEQDDDSAQQLFDNQHFVEWLNRGVSNVGQLVTFRDMLKILFQYIYYECVPNVTPKYVQGTRAKIKKVKGKTAPAAQSDNVQTAVPIHGDLADLYNEAKGVADGTIGGDLKAKAASMSESVKKIANSKDLPAKVKKNLDITQNNFNVIATTPGIKDKQIRLVFQGCANNLGIALGVGAVPSSSRPKDEASREPVQKEVEADRLYTQIFRPDCFFAAPPTCNVFFPEIYTSFNFTKNFLQEVTRLRLNTSMTFAVDTGALAQFHYAPDSASIEALAKKQGVDGLRALLPWEIYSGILPKFETCAEITHIAEAAEKNLGFSSQDIQGQAIDYEQRAANFNYIKYRFASRGCDLSMKFNPFAVCGFPAAVISQPFSLTNAEALEAINELNRTQGDTKVSLEDLSDNIREIARITDAPTHYLGMVAGLSHMVSQEGGITNISLTHARTHRSTDDDFLNVFSTEQTNLANKRIVDTILDADKALQEGDWRTIKFLIDATPQEDIHKRITQTSIDDTQDAAETDSETSVDVAERPDALPDMENLSLVSGNPPAPFAGLLSGVLGDIPDLAFVEVADTVPAPDGTLSITGGTKEAPLVGSRQTILEPNPYSPNLRKQSTGPKGGKIVQIQCVNNSVLDVSVTKLDKLATPQQVASLKKKVKGTGPDKTFFMWRKIIIYEEVTDDTPIGLTIPVEEALRPPWFSPLYSNWLIGDNIYQPFFGCGSVVDQAVFTSPNGTATFGQSSDRADLLDQLRDAAGDAKKQAKILDELKNPKKLTKLSDVPDIEGSLDALAYLYGEVRRMGLDVTRFVHDYVFRPIATMENIFGTQDLTYVGDSNESISTDQRTQRPSQTETGIEAGDAQKLTLKKGTPGFHSTAILPVGNLLGLLENPNILLPKGRTEGAVYPISKTLDPRPGRRFAVQEYATSLELGSGRLGIGLPG